jgi:hypothetical protein
VHWQAVRVERERDAATVVSALLALVGHVERCQSRYPMDDDAKRITGAVLVAPRTSHTRYGVRVEYLTGRIVNGVEQTARYVRQPAVHVDGRYSRRPEVIVDCPPFDGPTWVRRGALWSTWTDRHELPWTAKLVRRRADDRVRERTDSRREVERSSKASGRFTAAARDARSALVTGAPLGRSNSRQYVVARTALAVAVMAGSSAVDVLDVWTERRDTLSVQV